MLDPALLHATAMQCIRAWICVAMSFVDCAARSFCQRATLSKHVQGKTDLLRASSSGMRMDQACGVLQEHVLFLS